MAMVKTMTMLVLIIPLMVKKMMMVMTKVSSFCSWTKR